MAKPPTSYTEYFILAGKTKVDKQAQEPPLKPLSSFTNETWHETKERLSIRVGGLRAHEVAALYEILEERMIAIYCGKVDE